MRLRPGNAYGGFESQRSCDMGVSMKYNIPDRAFEDIVFFARKHRIDKVILFGSRARGTYNERSDIDIAVSGGHFQDFYLDVNEKAWTLLMFDIVELDKGISGELQREIERDGIIIYEKI